MCKTLNITVCKRVSLKFQIKMTLRILVIIDMTDEQLFSGPNRISAVYPSAFSLINNIQELSNHFPQDQIVDTHLCFDATEHRNSLHYLYPSVGMESNSSSALIPELRSLNATFIEKKQYSAFGNSQLFSYLQSIQRQNEKGNNQSPSRSVSSTDLPTSSVPPLLHLYITGINTDYCVFATALDAFSLNLSFTLVEDAVGSIRGETGHHEGLDMYTRFFCNGENGKYWGTAKRTKDIIKEFNNKK